VRVLFAEQKEGQKLFLSLFAKCMQALLFVGCRRATGTSSTFPWRGARCRLFMTAVTLLVPATAFESKTAKGNDFFDAPSAFGALPQRRVRKFLSCLKNDSTVVAFVFINGHGVHLISKNFAGNLITFPTLVKPLTGCSAGFGSVQALRLRAAIACDGSFPLVKA
jgi:hypothetical protein